MKHYYTDNSDLESKPRWIDYSYKDIVIKLKSDSGVFSKEKVDFGSNVLLHQIEIDENKDATLLDVGCGYGVIGLSLCKKYPKIKALLVDVNDRALNLTNENIELNQINNATVKKSYCYNEVEGTFDFIISNPPIRAGKEVVHTILEEAKNHLNDKGSLWIVIQKKQGAPSAKKKMEEVFGNCEIKKRDKGYYILVSYK